MPLDRAAVPGRVVQRRRGIPARSARRSATWPTSRTGRPRSTSPGSSRAARDRRRPSTFPCRRRCAPSAAAGCGAAGWSARRPAPASGCPWGIRPPCARCGRPAAARRPAGPAADLADGDVARRRGARPSRAAEPEAEPAGLAVDHQRGDAGSPAADRPPAATGPARPGRTVARPSVTSDQQRPAPRVADPFQPERLRRAEQALGQRRAAAARQLGEPAGGDVDRGGRRQRQRRARRRGR